MCGRYSLTESGEQIAARFLLEPADALSDLAPRYNIAPTQEVLTIVAAGAGRRVARARWGFLPLWARNARTGSINARSETAAESRMFGAAVRARRCIVPACGFFEWRREGSARLPVRFAPAGGGLWGLAGIWEPGGDGNGAGGSAAGSLPTVAILTTRANALVGALHDRMPVILRPELEAAWLDAREGGAAVLSAAAEPYPDQRMAAVRVSAVVNSPRNDVPECIAALP